MSCCGKQRESMRGQNTSGGGGEVTPFIPQARDFEYIGSGEMQVIGPLTGTVYTFRGGGARVHIHPADVASLVSIPNLRMLG